MAIADEVKKAENEDDPQARVQMLAPYTPVLMVLADREETKRRIRLFISTKFGWIVTVLTAVFFMRDSILELLGMVPK